MSLRYPHYGVAILIVVAHIVLVAKLLQEQFPATRESASVVMAVRLLDVQRASRDRPVPPGPVSPVATDPRRERARAPSQRPMSEPTTATTAARSRAPALSSEVPMPPAEDARPTDSAATIGHPDASLPSTMPALRLPRLSDLAHDPRGASSPRSDQGEVVVTTGRLREEDLGNGRRRIFLDGHCWDTSPSRASQLDPAGMSPSARDLHQVRPC